MLKNEYQGGNFIEIFNPSLKDPLVNCKVVGTHGVQKIYEKDVKSSVFQIDGISTATKICIPKDSKQGLSLIQRCIVFQLELKNGQEFSIEIGISDLNLNKRHLLFSTAHKDISVQPLSARIPLKNLNRGEWLNFVIDIASLLNDIWKNQTFRTIDTITVCANCKLRKIFSLKNVPTVESGLLPENILNQVDFPIGTDSKIQIFNINDSRTNESLETSRLKSTDSSLSESYSKSKGANVFKIAFGTKVLAQNLQTTKTKPKLITDEPTRKDSLNDDSLNLSSLSTKKQDSIANQENQENEVFISNKIKSSTSIKRDKEKLNATNVKPDSNGLKKVPHPPAPPQSTRRPTIISARKVRLSTKNSQDKANDENIENKNGNEQNQNQSLNESITDIIQTLKLNEKSNNSEKALNDSNNSNMYSFSSKPIVVDVENRKTQQNQNHQSKVYDFRKYTSNSPQKSQNNVNKVNTDEESQTQTIVNNDEFNEFMKPAKEQFHTIVNTLMDSFEAKMLMDIKAEMDQNNKNIDSQMFQQQQQQLHVRQTTVLTTAEVISSSYSPLIFESKSNSKKPREEDNNSIEKYHYENLTNSFDTDTTASISKKILRKKPDESNNYQDEMDVSLAANIARNSVNINNYQTNNTNKRKENPITEETRRYDDSQATDDVTDDNSEDEIDLLYDAALNCYYDPKTCTYYELNMT